MANPVTPFALCYPAPWRLQGAEVVDRDGCHVHGFDDDDPDHVEFWRGVVEAVNAAAPALEQAPVTQPCSCCQGTGWVDDQNWSWDYPDLPQERVPGSGKIRCMAWSCTAEEG